MSNEARIKELLEDQSFADKLYKVKNVVEAKALFAENGVELTDEQFRNLTSAAGADEELSVESLEKVSGGFFQYLFTCMLFGENSRQARNYRNSHPQNFRR